VFSNFVAPAAGIIGERLAFTASLGFCIVIAWLLVHIFKVDVTRSQITFKDLPISFLIVTGLILALYSGKTFSRNFKWENRITLMQHDIENLENSSIANSLYAKNLMATLDQLTTAQRQQRIAKAEKHLKQSIDIYPAFFNNWYDLGRIQLMQKQYDRALTTFKRAIELDSTYPKTYMKIAGIYQKKGNRRKEFAYVKQAFDKQPTNERAGTYLGEFYMKQNQMEKAIDVLQKLVRNAPNSYQGRKKLGRAYFQSKRYKQAAQALEKAYQIRQNDYELVVNLSEIYRELGNKRKAEFYGKRARQLKGSQGRN
jgi:tetratricopeptide (TPR) repeat protein